MTDANAMLREGVAKRDVVSVQLAFARGADPALQGDEGYLVLEVVEAGDLAVLKTFLAAGLPVDLGKGPDMTPLFVAAFCETPRAPALVALLLSHGADPNAVWQPEGETPLTTVLTTDADDAVRVAVLGLLLGAGANVETPRGDGFRPLQLAASLPSPVFCERLLDAGADPRATRVGHPDVDAVSVADYRGHAEVLALLQRRGAPGAVTRSEATLDALWARVDAVLEPAGVPEDKLAPSDPAALTEATGFPLSADLMAQWSRSCARPSIYEYTLLSAKRSLQRWRGLGRLLDEGTFAGWAPKELDASRREVAPVWWSGGWVPIAEDGGGNLICIDHTPGAMGARGQVIYWEKHAGPVGPCAPTWSAFLEDYATKLEAGRFQWDDAGLFEP